MILSLEIPDDKKDLIVDALCELGNYQETIDQYDDVTGETTEIPNPISRPLFAKSEIIRLLKERVKRQIQREDEPIFHTALEAKKKTIDDIVIL